MAHPRRPVALIGSLVVATLLSGCAPVADQLDSALRAANSAVQSAALTLRLRAEDRATDAVTATTLDDARTELVGEATTVSELSTPNETESRSRQSVLTLIRSATDAVNDASDALGAGRPLESASAELESLGKQLDAAVKQSERGSEQQQ